MHPRTISTLEEIDQRDWFRNVGIRDTEAAEILSSWQDAIKNCSMPEWRNLRQEAVNQYSARIIERSVVDYRKWNDVIIEVKPLIKK